MRFAGGKGEAESSLPSILDECEKACLPLLTPKVVYAELTKEELFALVPSAAKSAGLNEVLFDAEKVILFAATVGLSVDRLIARYAQISPVKALFFQALGAERIESLCDLFCEEWERKKGVSLGRRYSAGYGDFPLEAQKDIFSALDCPKRIGLTLTDSLMMTPTKSVTAIVPIGGKKCKTSCETCEKTDCGYRV